MESLLGGSIEVKRTWKRHFGYLTSERRKWWWRVWRWRQVVDNRMYSEGVGKRSGKQLEG